MAKRKGLSADEKRNRILEIFREKREAFQLKEVEKIASKEKGVVPQTVKEILKELVDDNLVDSDKIGTSVYFWAFPGKVSQQRLARLADLREKLKKLHQAQAEILRKLEEKQTANKENDDSEKLVIALKQLQVSNKELEERHRRLAENDPEMVNRLKEEIQSLITELHQWTEDLFSMCSWVKAKAAITAEAYDALHIPRDLDYVE